MGATRKAATLLAGVVLLSGCAITTTSPGSAADPRAAVQSATVAPGVVSDLTVQAGEDAARAVLPAGARESAGPSSALLSAPGESPGCIPVIDVIKYWTVPSSTVPDVTNFLGANPTPSFTGAASGTSSGGDGTISAFVAQTAAPYTPTSTTLVFTYTELPTGDVAVRVDAEIVPSGAACTRYGAAATP